MAADGVAHAEISRRFAISRQTVISWRACYHAHGIEACATRTAPVGHEPWTTTLTPPLLRKAVARVQLGAVEREPDPKVWATMLVEALV
ncbi:helix-turn-helix domain-containing protein [Nocardia sp. NPDC057663]|uniref:helix-turn-helix domain-containing protein n=1 Tax=Nocardia sp. NPDC057663 TaxID=3346201 RepID=UPI00366CEF90